jgi:hypothetical protein
VLGWVVLDVSKYHAASAFILHYFWIYLTLEGDGKTFRHNVGNIQPTSQRHMTEEQSPRLYRCENLKTFVFNTTQLELCLTQYRGADKSLARPISRCILFDGENISFAV